MSKFDDYMDEYVEDIAGMAIKRRHTMSLPRVDYIRKIFDEIYQRGYDEATEETAYKKQPRRQHNG
ncbi:hypothetical protein LLQ46_11655 [Rouxiella badensis]|uniref:hypothetical protein n=1 Tax=Rouxiella badensis TaxID=1646377 RepID=UPI001B414217|nr:hypothetical protein [Rouxiella badensis]MCC3747504.1 hypothetical protein [Rouxiella badensis]